MAHAEICPVCKGKGRIDGNTCHGCDGKGWIAIRSEEYFPVVPYPIISPCPSPWHIVPVFPGTEYWWGAAKR